MARDLHMANKASEIRISHRLQAIAGMVKYPSMVDIGTDHGLLPIYMAQQGLISCALATDLNFGPLERARKNIIAAKLTNCIKTQLCNGLDDVNSLEYETCVIAGMGGGLIIDILQQNMVAAHRFKQILLSPQRDVADVRRFLHQNRFCIDNEELIEEKGKFYNIMDVSSGSEAPYDEKGYVFGKILLQKESEVFRNFVNAEVDKVKKIKRDEVEKYLQLCLEVIKCLQK